MSKTFDLDTLIAQGKEAARKHDGVKKAFLGDSRSLEELNEIARAACDDEFLLRVVPCTYQGKSGHALCIKSRK